MSRLVTFPPVTRLGVRYRDDGPEQSVGVLARGRTVAFQYDAPWLALGVELSPDQLPLSVGREVQLPPSGARLHGLFADVLPDAWGERMMRMAFHRRGVSWDKVTELDRLAWLGTRGIGALSFAPASELDLAEPTARPSFDDLVRSADAVLAGEPTRGDEHVLDRLLRAAGSAGGAQPKVLVGLRQADDSVDPDPEPGPGFTPYLVKLSPTVDAMQLGPAIGTIELAYAEMARAAGITMPDARLLRTSDGRLHFAVARFDRTPSGGRRHVHSLAGLLGRAPADAYDYDELLTVTLNLTGDQRAVREALARGAFNVFAGNDDDHGRNTSFLLDPLRGWTLSPAYDLVFQPGRGSRAMTVRGKDQGIRRDDFVALGTRHVIPTTVMTDLLDRVTDAIARWPAFADAAGVPAGWRDDIARVMAERIDTPTGAR